MTNISSYPSVILSSSPILLNDNNLEMIRLIVPRVLTNRTRRLQHYRTNTPRDRLLPSLFPRPLDYGGFATTPPLDGEQFAVCPSTTSLLFHSHFSPSSLSSRPPTFHFQPNNGGKGQSAQRHCLSFHREQCLRCGRQSS